jgi:serine/threonine protein kinase
MENIPKIAGYTIERKLGEGGMAKVYFGVQEKLKRDVAIKILEPLLLKDEDFALRFLKEAETAANLIHPNIVTIYDVGQEENHYYMVMEFLAGTLKDRIRTAQNEVTLTQGYTPVTALKIVRQVASALDYAHKRGFIHRDIKPDNIMFRHDGTPVLVDFGIAKAVGATTKLTRTGMSIGTPHYMSPEQIRGQEIDGRADFYSLGIVFYEMLIGAVPFTASDYIAVAMKHLSEPVPTLPDYLAQYQTVLDKMLAKEKAARVQDGQELIQLLDSYIDNKPLAPQAPPTVSPPNETMLELEQTRLDEIAKPRKKRGRGRTIASLFILFLLLSGTLGYIVTQQRGMFPALDQALESIVQKFGLTLEPQAQLDPAQDPLSTPLKTEETTPSNSQTIENKSPDLMETKVEVKETPVVEKKLDKVETKKTTAPPKKTPPPQVKETKVDTIPKRTEQSQPKASEPKVSPQQANTNAPVINILNLFPGLIREYSDHLKRLTVPGLPKGLLAKGRVSFNFSIGADGRLTVVRFNNRGLEVKPLFRRRKVVGMIYNAMEEIQLRRPKDRKGQPAQVENWRLSFKVGTFQGKIILTRI